MIFLTRTTDGTNHELHRYETEREMWEDVTATLRLAKSRQLCVSLRMADGGAVGASWIRLDNGIEVTMDWGKVVPM